MLPIIVILFLILLFSCTAYYIVFYSPHKVDGDPHSIPSGAQFQRRKELMLQLVDEFMAIPYEELEILSHDGLRLTGKYYAVRDGAPVDLCFHGYRGSGARDFCGGAKIPLAIGHNMILVDQRAQGKSAGHSICFGIKERFDCISWINYVLCRFGEDTQINLFGVSMGASTVLMASGLDLPDNVKHIIADCPYNSVSEVIRYVGRRRKLPVFLLYPFISLGALLFAGLWLPQGNCAAAVKRAKVPILILHGEDDHLVPCEMSEVIRQANPQLVQRVTFPNAGHGISYIEDRPRYERLVRHFLHDQPL